MHAHSWNNFEIYCVRLQIQEKIQDVLAALLTCSQTNSRMQFDSILLMSLLCRKHYSKIWALQRAQSCRRVRSSLVSLGSMTLIAYYLLGLVASFTSRHHFSILPQEYSFSFFFINVALAWLYTCCFYANSSILQSTFSRYRLSYFMRLQMSLRKLVACSSSCELNQKVFYPYYLVRFSSTESGLSPMMEGSCSSPLMTSSLPCRNLQPADMAWKI